MKARIDFICALPDADRFMGVVTEAARTGRRGDGIVSLHPVGDVRKIRSGAAGEEALR